MIPITITTIIPILSHTRFNSSLSHSIPIPARTDPRRRSAIHISFERRTHFLPCCCTLPILPILFHTIIRFYPRRISPPPPPRRPPPPPSGSLSYFIFFSSILSFLSPTIAPFLPPSDWPLPTSAVYSRVYSGVYSEFYGPSPGVHQGSFPCFSDSSIAPSPGGRFEGPSTGLYKGP